ncbi:hypothetical protein SCA6_012897 [Theobroma cacao]
MEKKIGYMLSDLEIRYLSYLYDLEFGPTDHGVTIFNDLFMGFLHNFSIYIFGHISLASSYSSMVEFYLDREVTLADNQCSHAQYTVVETSV